MVGWFEVVGRFGVIGWFEVVGRFEVVGWIDVIGWFEVIAWFEEIKAVIELRNTTASSTLDPALNMTDGLRRRFNASNKEPINNTSNDSSSSAVRGRSGSEGDDDADDEDGMSGHNRATSNSLGSNGLHGRVKSISNINVNGNGSYVDQRNDQVMNLLRSRGLSHGYGGRKRNKRLQATLKVPLAESVKQLVSLYREADAWQLLGVEDDVRISLLKPDIAQERGLAYPTPIGKQIFGSCEKQGKM